MKGARLYIYYRVASGEQDRAMACAHCLFNHLKQIGCDRAELLVRVEDGKPYSTLMEVLEVPPQLSINEFKNSVLSMAASAFQDLPTRPDRVVEVFIQS